MTSTNDTPLSPDAKQQSKQTSSSVVTKDVSEADSSSDPKDQDTGEQPEKSTGKSKLPALVRALIFIVIVITACVFIYKAILNHNADQEDVFSDFSQDTVITPKVPRASVVAPDKQEGKSDSTFDETVPVEPDALDDTSPQDNSDFAPDIVEPMEGISAGIVQHEESSTASKSYDTLDQILALEQIVQNQRSELASMKQSLDTLNDTVETYEEQTLKRRAIMQHFATFRRAVLGGESYATSLDALLASELVKPEIKEQLAYFSSHQSDGISSMGDIRANFNVAITGYYHQGESLPEDARWWEKVTHWFKSLIVIRKTGAEHNGQDDESILARTEALVLSGEIDEALDELRKLSVRTSPHFHTWQRQASRNLESRKLLRSLEPKLSGL